MIITPANDNCHLHLVDEYTPFSTTLTNPLSNKDQAGSTGHIKDSATGLQPLPGPPSFKIDSLDQFFGFANQLRSMQARYYDPALGRFLSIDPVGFSPDQPFMFNRYTYVANDPINLVDPNGAQAEEAIKDFFGGGASVANAYRVLGMHATNKVGSPAQRAQAARVEATIGIASQIIQNDPLEATALFAQSMNDQGLAYLVGRTAAQSAITAYGVRKLGGKTKAGKTAAAIGVGSINFTATQAGSVLNGFYKLDNQLTDAGLELGGLSVDAATTLIGPLAAGSSVNFDQQSGQVSLVTEVTTTGSRIPKTVETPVCTFSDGACK